MKCVLGKFPFNLVWAGMFFFFCLALGIGFVYGVDIAVWIAGVSYIATVALASSIPQKVAIGLIIGFACFAIGSSYVYDGVKNAPTYKEVEDARKRECDGKKNREGQYIGPAHPHASNMRYLCAVVLGLLILAMGGWHALTTHNPPTDGSTDFSGSAIIAESLFWTFIAGATGGLVFIVGELLMGEVATRCSKKEDKG